MAPSQEKLSNHTQALQQLARVFVEIPFNRMLGLRLNTLEKDEITMMFDMQKELVGNYLYGILHGGVISSVLDMAGGMAAMVSVIHRQTDQTLEEMANIIGKSSTIDLHINYIRPGKGNHFIAKASVVHTGNKICFARMELCNDESTLIATGTGTYLVG